MKDNLPWKWMRKQNSKLWNKIILLFYFIWIWYSQFFIYLCHYIISHHSIYDLYTPVTVVYGQYFIVHELCNDWLFRCVILGNLFICPANYGLLTALILGNFSWNRFGIIQTSPWKIGTFDHLRFRLDQDFLWPFQVGISSKF